MQRIGTVILFLTMAIGLIVGTQPVQAQMSDQDDSSAGQIELGGGLVFGSQADNLGLRVEGLYNINPQIDGSAEFTYFFQQNPPGGTSTFVTINADAHYAFPMEDQEFNVYGLGGLNLAISSTSVSFGGQNFSSSASRLGLNLGGGVEFPVDFGLLYGELKYVISDFDQFVIGGGVRIPLGG